MPVAYRSVTSSTGLSPSLPSGTTTDDIVLAIYSVESTTATVTAPSGWTAIQTDTNVAAFGVLQHRTYWARKTASALSTTWTDGGAGGRVCLITYSGCTTTGSPINTSSYTEDGDESISLASITPSVADCMIVGLVNQWSWGTYSSTDFANERLDQAEAIAIYDDGLLASGSTGAMAVTSTGAVIGGTMVALEPAGGAAAASAPVIPPAYRLQPILGR